MAILALAFDGRLYEHHIHSLKKYSKIKNISSYGHICPALWSEPPIRTMNCIHNFGGGLLETRTMHLVHLKNIKD